MKLDELRQLALALPDVGEQPHFEYTSFRVNRKIFATAPPDGLHVHLFLAEEAREQALAMWPEACSKLLWGGKVVGLRVELARIGLAQIRPLVEAAWASKAPARLVRSRAGGA